MHAIVDHIQSVDLNAGEETRRYLDTLTKPPGSLGALEELAIQLSAITGELKPSVAPPAVVVFAADHGVADEGVSAFPQAVTAQMVVNFANGGAAINVFARQIGALVEIVDVGVASPLTMPGVTSAKVRHGTANMVLEDAMQCDQAIAAIDVGIAAVKRAKRAGAKCIMVGEMGIANTTASSAMLAVLTGQTVASVVGAGTGIDPQQQAHKVAVIERAIAARSADPQAPLEALAKLGGLEIAAMTGAYLEAAAQRLPAIVDGFIATVAALTACRLCPAVRGYLIFGHRSQEPGHDVALKALEAKPLLDMGMRLGEGSGAALAYPLLQAATAMVAEMATFADAGVSDKASP
ncbi:nicotinate-nucleotide--dimethylbenzimidazole phosphoribosyltransferase [Vreelandella titanicae]|uniref:nicotinate-nucleotide--dimethylbenzimidazole phosphoribosyltransferase n=1 Tax=Halomonadaceae TaxID=28256 RepID=UPI000481E830|nr:MULTISPECIES: nicotinate-nucleotide--dimethylbenzimidazole phosphoribosyltransferase [unclassified Halomonas]NAO97940.1 nicotinate-nucleotide--dimethylbenzimidazole phosphoribosyltransferase [Halomonas sp. MG34]PKH61013.1 nicotinate-nucleotide--dimethylbenzimidazole phosphoribosyltransferase [Halomonas sp. Choline-3u-9]QGQ70899.1 nicotinate-nucleotide--dimethylbenzimidazole phosphoribosyltransferase [Halomonas sp. PA16-9]